MLIRQLIDSQSSTYSYLLADQGQALLIDPVRDKLDDYLRLLGELQLQLIMAIDSHTHADHITALGLLREHTGCATAFGEPNPASCASFVFHDHQKLDFGQRSLTAWHTPGHTDDSYCFVLWPQGQEPACVFSGDTLLIRGTGRTDFQNGDAHAQWNSLQRLLTLPDATLVYPAHDYKGWTCSSIGEERRHNPRLQVADADEYARLMAGLKLAEPKMIDIAIPANRACGRL
ncbi:Beta-lactamase hydrolase-like protein [compost metagenome]